MIAIRIIAETLFVTIIVFFIAFLLELNGIRLFAPDFLTITPFIVVFTALALQNFVTLKWN